MAVVVVVVVVVVALAVVAVARLRNDGSHAPCRKKTRRKRRIWQAAGSACVCGVNVCVWRP